MEFKDLATKFEGLTADQVGVLAEFGKDILDDAGIFGLPSCLLGLIQDILNIDEFDIEENRFTIRSLLHIVELANELNEQCWLEHKTPFGLTGIRNDNQYVGLDNETEIIARESIDFSIPVSGRGSSGRIGKQIFLR